jgi:Asp-tRNA(Asn)/Glu-tRNA(Gln) amidotransferase A subunit family amidase
MAGFVPRARGSDPTAQTTASSAPVVTAQTLAEAEKLAGISFTEAEREQIATTIGQNLTRHAARRSFPLLNSMAPACVFDPRLPGMTLEQVRRPIVRSDDDPGSLPRNDEDFAFAPVTSLSRWIERRQLSSERLTTIYLDRLRRLGPRLECVVTLTDELALRQARQADAEIAAGKYRGPLHGIPWGAKDLLDTAGIATTWGAEPWQHRVPEADAVVVKRLADAGAVLIAKLALGALAYGDIWFGGRTKNPWNLATGSSGSSAGSAAATAAGLVGFSIGTETLGSIVSPCMVCGTTGLRPTFGRVPRTGAMALCWSLDKIGPIGRCVEDCALVLSHLHGSDAGDASSLDMPFNFDARAELKGLRVGWSPRWFEGEPAHDLDRAALAALRNLGVDLVELVLPDWPYDTLLTILLAEAASAFEDLTRNDLDDELDWQAPEAWPNTLRETWFTPAIELVEADRFRREVMSMMARQFERVSAIIAPSFAASLLLITNHTGHPALTVRCGFKRDKAVAPETPHGITLIGRLFDEATLCRLGMALERALDLWRVRPQVD